MEPQLELPPAQGDGCLQLETIAILDRRMVKRYNRPVTEMRVHSSNSFPEDATWHMGRPIQATTMFPNFQPQGQCLNG